MSAAESRAEVVDADAGAVAVKVTQPIHNDYEEHQAIDLTRPTPQLDPINMFTVSIL